MKQSQERDGSALRIISALSALRYFKMILRRFGQSRIAFSEKLRNTPSIIFSDLLGSVLRLEICSVQEVFQECFLRRKNIKKIYLLGELREMKF